MKGKHLLAVLALAFSYSVWADAPVFKPLADFNNLFTGDKVVITMAYHGIVYGLNAEVAFDGNSPSSKNPASDTLTLNSDGALENPYATYIFTAVPNGDGWEFVHETTQLYLNKSGNAVRVGSPGATAGKVWKLHPTHQYLYSVIPNSTDTLYLGVYHSGEGTDGHCKKFTHYPYSTAPNSGWKKLINDEEFALYVNSPTSDPTKPKYNINVAAVEGGSLSVPFPKAGEGAVIPVEVTPAKGFDYVEGSLCIKYNDGAYDRTVYAMDGQFVMPNFPVSVTAEFEGRGPIATIDFANDGNLWSLPDASVSGSNTYTYNALSIGVSGSGYYWKELSTESYLLIGQKDAKISLPVFGADEIVRIEVTGQKDASAQTEMNILVGGNPVSTKTVGSQETNIYLIAASAREKGTQYDLSILNNYNARITYIDIYAAVPDAPEAPVADLAEGLYTTAQMVNLSCVTDGAEIHYTIDGSRPTELSPVYNSPIELSASLVIRAIAIKNGIKSEQLHASYVIANVEHDGSATNPYTIADVKLLNSPGWKAWVHGFIIDGFEPNITIRDLSPDSETAIAIADASDETDKSKMVFVELTSASVRKALNIKSHPENKSREVWIYGVLSNYGGKPGLSKASKYAFTTPTAFEEMPVTDNPSPVTATKFIRNGQLYIIKDGNCYNAQGLRTY